MYVRASTLFSLAASAAMSTTLLSLSIHEVVKLKRELEVATQLNNILVKNLDRVYNQVSDSDIPNEDRAKLREDIKFYNIARNFMK